MKYFLEKPIILTNKQDNELLVLDELNKIHPETTARYDELSRNKLLYLEQIDELSKEKSSIKNESARSIVTEKIQKFQRDIRHIDAERRKIVDFAVKVYYVRYYRLLGLDNEAKRLESSISAKY